MNQHIPSRMPLSYLDHFILQKCPIYHTHTYTHTDREKERIDKKKISQNHQWHACMTTRTITAQDTNNILSIPHHYRRNQLTIHESGPIPQPQNDQENYFQRVQHSQTGNEYMHKAWIHFQTSNQTPGERKGRTAWQVRMAKC